VSIIALDDLRMLKDISGGMEATAQDFIDMVDPWAIETIGCDPASAARTERLSGDGTVLLYPSYWPVTAVTSIGIENLGMTLTTMLYSATTDSYQDVFVPAHGEWLEMRAPSDSTNGLGVWPRGTGNIKLVYTAGYATIPADLKGAIAMATLIVMAERTKLGKTQVQVGAEAVREIVRKSDEYPFIMGTFARFQRKRIG